MRWSVVAWIGVWAFWLATTRSFHANWTLATIATTAMVVCFATAAYLNHLVLVPRFWRTRQYTAYVESLLLAMLGLTGVALAVIRLFYTVVFGPFPVKPWYVDYGLDFTGMVVHVAAAAAIVWLFGHICAAGFKQI
ncbi:MAG: hypothetical protein AB7G28_19065 [Pirellulales bacterium]